MKWIANRSTAAKLLLAFVLVLVLTTIIGGVGLYQASQIRDDGETIGHTWMAGTEKAGMLHAMLWEHRTLDFRRIDGNLGGETAQRLSASADSIESLFEVTRKDYEQGLATEEQRRAYNEMAQAWKAYVEQDQRVADLLKGGRFEDARTATLGPAEQAATATGDALDRLLQVTSAGAKSSLTHADGEYATARGWIIAVLLAALVLGLLLAALIARAISRPLGLAVVALDRVASGDLTARIEVNTTDEVGQMARALNGALDSIAAALRDVRDSADATSSSAQQLQAASEEISAGAQEQATSLEETAASLEEMTASVRQNSDHAQQADQLATNARDVAERGGKVVLEAVEAMAQISDASGQIAEISSTIDEIAFQTNILALNAAVEAARAGQQGRGFAVVAGEVRTLAQRSAAAAKEIKALIQGSGRKVEVGRDLVHRSGESLQEIVHAVKRVSDIVGDMAAASREQASGIDQVNRAIAQMDSVTQSNASQTEELASTAEALAAQAEQLQALVGRFTVDTNVHASPRPRSPRAGAAPRSSLPHAGGVHVRSIRPVHPGHLGLHAPGNGKTPARREVAAAMASQDMPASGHPEEALPDLDGFQEY